MNESINLTAVLLASVAQFILGADLVHAALWPDVGKIHGFDKLKQKRKKKCRNR